MSTHRTHDLRIGAIEATVLDDGPITAPAGFLFANADPEQLQRTLRAAGLAPDGIAAGLAGMLLGTPAGERVLLDPGTGGRWHPGLGALPAALANGGHRAEEIDLVVISHGHPDHLGGLLDPSDELRYPNARHIMSAVEWRFWTSPDRVAGLDPSWVALADQVLPRLHGRLWLTEGPTRVADGITTLPAPGHTPGHMGARIESEGEVLLWLGDAFGHPLGVERPDWAVATDGDLGVAERTRRWLLDEAHLSNATVFVNHFPFPAVGRVVRDGDAYAWRGVGAATAV